jgi:hypothetical protein
MKKVFIFLLTIIVIFTLIEGYFLLTKNISNNSKSEFTQTELINKIIPEMKDYCQDLQSKAINSACPTCKFPNIETCNIVEGKLGTSMGDECLIKKNGEDYIIQVKRDLIYGRNDRPGTVILTFNINSNGKIISKDLPEKSCV